MHGWMVVIFLFFSLLGKEKRTMLLTSHDYQDIEELCDIVYLIDEGKLAVLTNELKEKYFNQ